MTLVLTAYFLAYDPAILLPLEQVLIDSWAWISELSFLKNPETKKVVWGRVIFTVLFSMVILKFAVLDVLAMILGALQRKLFVHRH